MKDGKTMIQGMSTEGMGGEKRKVEGAPPERK